MTINSEMLIKVNADIKSFNDKIDQVKKKTEDLSDSLGKIGIGAGIAFAGLAAITFKTVDEFKKAKIASDQLERSLKNQGIFTEELAASYKKMALEIRNAVGVDDDLITSGQAKLQSFIGQNKITKELTQATIDFAAFTKTDLDTAFQIVGKTIGTKLNPLARAYGIELQDGLTVSEKMAVVTEKLNEKFAGQAKVIGDTRGPLERLGVIFGDLQENIGKELAPAFDSLVTSATSFVGVLAESETAMKSIALIIAGGLGFAGLALGVVAGVQAFIALNAAALALGTTLTVLSGGLFAVVVGVGALVAVMAQTGKRPKTIEDASKAVDDLKKKIEDIKRRDPNGIALNGELFSLQRALKTAEKDLKSFNKEKEKLGTATSGKQAVEDILAESKKREDLKKQKEDDAKKELADREKLRTDLIDAGKDEFTKLMDIRDRRIQIAKGDKSLLLQIEKDFQDKKLKLERDSADKLNELRKAQSEYEKKLKADNLKALQDGANNPFSLFNLPDDATDAEKKNAALGAGAGVLNNVAQGASGAKNLVVEGGALAVDAFAPGLGQALKPLIGQLTQGPEATRAFVKEFANAVPDLIQALIESIPVLIEELANQTPIIIERLVEKLPEITSALVRSMPKVAVALALQMPKVALAFIKEIPNMAVEFVNALVKEAPRFITELIKSIGKGAGGILSGAGDFLSGIPVVGDIIGGAGGVVSDVVGSIGDVFGFAEGGQLFAKGVPSGFANDTFNAKLSSGELVVDRTTASGLREFINDQGSSDLNSAILNKILAAVSAPVNVVATANVREKAFADIILQLNRTNQRLT